MKTTNAPLPKTPAYSPWIPFRESVPPVGKRFLLLADDGATAYPAFMAGFGVMHGEDARRIPREDLANSWWIPLPIGYSLAFERR